MKKILCFLLSLFLFAGCSDEEPLYPIEQDTGFMYERQQLTEEQTQDYDAIYEAFMEMEDSVHIESEDEDEILKIYNAVLFDHPEIFWVSDEYDASYLNIDSWFFDTKLNITYSHSKEETAEYQRQLDEKTAEITAGIAEDASDYEKVKYVYDYIIDHTEYKLLSSQNQNIVSVLLHEKSVCAGYARTMQYLLDKLGVPCSYMVGNSIEENEGHAWNMVQMDGEYYYVDATYGDQIIDDDSHDNKTYAYFGMTSSEMLLHYVPEGTYEETAAIQDTYYMQEGAYFESVDRQQIYDLILKNSGSISIKCSNADVYAQMKAYLLDQYQLFELLELSGQYKEYVDYLEYEDMNIITFIY